jgi:guanosine-3',5'-bis(diphosphate) 3'-pyrophosphohydrolase
MKHVISQAIAFATEKHNGQFDKSGNPYILHPLKVMHYLRSQDEELMAIAVLHDVVEDCFKKVDEGLKALREIGMSVRVVEGVDILTKRPGQTYEEYVELVLTNDDAILVKMADLRHNMDVRRLKGITEKDMKRLEKYARTYTKLKEKALQKNLIHI